MLQPSFKPITPSTATPQIFPGAWRRDILRKEELGLTGSLSDIFQAPPIADSALSRGELGQRDALLDWFSRAYPWPKNNYYCFVDVTLRKPDGFVVIGTTLIPFEQKGPVYALPNLSPFTHPKVSHFFDVDSAEHFSDPAHVVLWLSRSTEGSVVPCAAVQLSNLASSKAIAQAQPLVLDYTAYIQQFVSEDGMLAPRPQYSEALCFLLDEILTQQANKISTLAINNDREAPPIIISAIESKSTLEVGQEIECGQHKLLCVDEYLAPRNDFGVPTFMIVRSKVYDPDNILGRGREITLSPYDNLRFPPIG